ncbi:hypothetical protein Gotur_019486 [Gossypium turneri]
MMRQPSASSTTLNSEYHHPGAPPPQMPPYDGRVIISVSFGSNWWAFLTYGVVFQIAAGKSINIEAK